MKIMKGAKPMKKEDKAAVSMTKIKQEDTPSPRRVSTRDETMPIKQEEDAIALPVQSTNNSTMVLNNKQDDDVLPLPVRSTNNSTMASIKQEEGMAPLPVRSTNNSAMTSIKQEDGVKSEDITISTMSSSRVKKVKNSSDKKQGNHHLPPDRAPIRIDECIETFVDGDVMAFLEFLDRERETPDFNPGHLATNVFRLQKKGKRALIRICGILEDSRNNPMPGSPSWKPYLKEYVAPKNRWHR